MTDSYAKLEKKIGINFKDKKILTEALTHKSFSSVDTKTRHNERIEFLGDAVLELIVTDFLFGKYPDTNEGSLTSFRSALVKTTSLAEEARKIGLGEHLIMSFGEESTGGRDREYILANAMEALIGAIYLDQGYTITEQFVWDHICYKLEEIINQKAYIDSKSMLQEVSQEELKITPTYKQIKEEGPDHDKHFTMGLLFGDKEITVGAGKSKREAEQDAAQKALSEWNTIKADFMSAHDEKRS